MAFGLPDLISVHFRELLFVAAAALFLSLVSSSVDEWFASRRRHSPSWSWFESKQRLVRRIIQASAVIALVTLAPALHRWSQLQLPLSLSFQVTLDRQLKIQNDGRPVEKVEITDAIYRFSPDDFPTAVLWRQPVDVRVVSVLGDLATGKGTVIDLAKWLNDVFYGHPDGVGHRAGPHDLTGHCVRVVFLDPRRQERLVHYEIIGSLIGFLTFFDSPQQFAGQVLDTARGLPGLIRRHCRQLAFQDVNRVREFPEIRESLF